MIKKLKYTIFCLLLLACPAHALEKGITIPDFKLSSNIQDKITLSQYRGHIVYLDFWASWCGPCKRSLPWMAKLQSEFEDRGLQVIAVNLDSDSADATKMLEDMNLKLPVAFDPEGKTPEAFGLDTMPTSYLIDKEGKLVEVFRGFDDSDKEAVFKKLQSLLN